MDGRLAVSYIWILSFRIGVVWGHTHAYICSLIHFSYSMSKKSSTQTNDDGSPDP
jgi:hypothetical protein